MPLFFFSIHLDNMDRAENRLVFARGEWGGGMGKRDDREGEVQASS